MQSATSQLSGVIFDMDGCLVDSEPLCLGAIAEECQSLGLKDVSAQDIGDRFLGVAMSKIESFAADRLGSPVPAGFATRIEDKLIDLYHKDLEQISGAEELLQRLVKQGFVIGLATGASVRRMGATLQISGLADRFADRAVSAETVAAGKPEPDIFLEAAKRMDIEPSECIVVEDSPLGVTGAVRAGMHAVGFVGGSHLKGRKDQHADILQRAGATEVFDDLGNLRDFVMSALRVER